VFLTVGDHDSSGDAWGPARAGPHKRRLTHCYFSDVQL